MLNPIERLEFGLSEVEKVLNVAGYVPGLNLMSSGLRMGIGKIQAIMGVAIGTLALLGSELSTDSEKRKQLEQISARAFEHAKHGIANIVRGVIEGGSPFFLGGVALYLGYDMHHYRFAYEGETKAKEIYGSFEWPSLSEAAEQIREIYQSV